MNILYVANHLNIGGITSYVLTLSRGMSLKGHKIYIASSQGCLKEKIEGSGAVYIPIPIKTKQELSPGVLISFLKLKEAVRRYGIDIVHTNSRTTQVLGCLLHKFLGLAHISTCHGFFKKRLSRMIFPCWGQRVIAISESVKEHLINDFKVDANKIDVVHNGIDLGRFLRPGAGNSEQAKKDLGLGSGPVVGIVARLSDVKGHKYLIRAAKTVLREFPFLQLLIVGEGKMKQELVSLVEGLKMEKNVFFIPPIQDTAAVLSVMDIFVMPSLKEGLGLALMEAMSMGLAVIGSAVGGIKTLIQDEVNGLLVSPRDTDALSRAITELLKDASKRKALGDSARLFITKDFSQEKMVEETERAYLECVRE